MDTGITLTLLAFLISVALVAFTRGRLRVPSSPVGKLPASSGRWIKWILILLAIVVLFTPLGYWFFRMFGRFTPVLSNSPVGEWLEGQITALTALTGYDISMSWVPGALGILLLIALGAKTIARVSKGFWKEFGGLVKGLILVGVAALLIHLIAPGVYQWAKNGWSGAFGEFVINPNDPDQWTAGLPGRMSFTVNPHTKVVMRGVRNNPNPYCVHLEVSREWAEYYDIITPPHRWEGPEEDRRGGTTVLSFSRELVQEIAERGILTIDVVGEVRDGYRVVANCEYPT